MLIAGIAIIIILALAYSLVRIGGESDEQMHKMFDEEIAKKYKAKP